MNVNAALVVARLDTSTSVSDQQCVISHRVLALTELRKAIGVRELKQPLARDDRYTVQLDELELRGIELQQHFCHPCIATQEGLARC